MRWGVRLKVAWSGKVDVSSQMAWPSSGISFVIRHLWFGLVPQPLPPGPSILSGANAQLLMGASPQSSPLCRISSHCRSPILCLSPVSAAPLACSGLRPELIRPQLPFFIMIQPTSVEATLSITPNPTPISIVKRAWVPEALENENHQRRK